MEPDRCHPPNHPFFLTNACRDEGEGSLFALLRKQGWATGLASGDAGTSFSAASFFMVRVSLTDEGQQHVPEVTALIFRYVDIFNTGRVQVQDRC